MLKRLLCGGIIALAAILAPLAQADEADVKRAIEAWLAKDGIKVDVVRKAGFLNLYEVQVGGDIIYTDDKANYVILGNVLDIKKRRNLTEERKDRLSQIKFSDLPLDLAVKTVKGNGKRVLVTFEDPNCGWCKKLAAELQQVDNVTIYTFLVPLLGGEDSNAKNRAIWCAPDRGKAWTEFMLHNTLPPEGKCAAPLDQVAALAHRLNVRGTPTLILADGTRKPTFLPAAKIEQLLNQPARNGN